MADLDHFDPTRALDSWRVPAQPPLDLDFKLQSPQPADNAGLDEINAGLGVAASSAVAFDAARALDGWRPPAPAPLDLALKSLRAGGSRPDGAKQAWLKARGYEMLDVEDVEICDKPPPQASVEMPAFEGPAEPDPQPVRETARIAEVVQPEPAAATVGENFAAPEPDAERVCDVVKPPPPAVEPPALDLHVAAAAVAPDPQQVIESIELPKVPPPAAFDAPVLDFRRLREAAPRTSGDPRLLLRWQPLAWTALARRVRTPGGPLVEAHGPQWLCALWRPQSVDAPLLGRWPELAGLIGADTAFGALHQLLAELPPRAQVWSAELETDWGLVAELVLHQDAGLRPLHAQALRELIEAERKASHGQVNGRYAARGRVVRRRA